MLHVSYTPGQSHVENENEHNYSVGEGIEIQTAITSSCGSEIYCAHV